MIKLRHKDLRVSKLDKGNWKGRHKRRRSYSLCLLKKMNKRNRDVCFNWNKYLCPVFKMFYTEFDNNLIQGSMHIYAVVGSVNLLLINSIT